MPWPAWSRSAGSAAAGSRRPRRGPGAGTELTPHGPGPHPPRSTTGTSTAARVSDTGTITEPELPPAPAPLVERPEPAAGRLVRLRARLARSQSALGQGLLALLSRDTLDADTWDEVEETLLLADSASEPTTELVDRLRRRVAVEGAREPERLRQLLREELLALVDPHDGPHAWPPTRHGGRPAVVLVVGVNGTGKTTTVGKLARVLVAQDKDVVLGAADTFRAAAADQLQTWGERVGVPDRAQRAGRRGPGGGRLRRRPGRDRGRGRRGAASTPPAGCRTRSA